VLKMRFMPHLALYGGCVLAGRRPELTFGLLELPANVDQEMVGVRGFEPPASTSRT
jgi:hypothetical protein